MTALLFCLWLNLPDRNFRGESFIRRDTGHSWTCSQCELSVRLVADVDASRGVLDLLRVRALDAESHTHVYRSDKAGT